MVRIAGSHGWGEKEVMICVLMEQCVLPALVIIMLGVLSVILCRKSEVSVEGLLFFIRVREGALFMLVVERKLC